MGILQLPMPLPAQIGILPGTRKMVTTDNLSTITTAGYLNAVNLESYPLAQTDTIECLYSFNTTTNAGTYGRFSVAIANGVITLSQTSASNAIVYSGALVSGDLPAFSGTTGTVTDSGIAATNVQLKTQTHAGSVAWAGGSASHAFTVTGLTTASIIIPAIQAQATGTVYIESYTVTANTVTVTFSADPGAMTLQYIAYIAPQ